MNSEPVRLVTSSGSPISVNTLGQTCCVDILFNIFFRKPGNCDKTSSKMPNGTFRSTAQLLLLIYHLLQSVSITSPSNRLLRHAASNCFECGNNTFVLQSEWSLFQFVYFIGSTCRNCFLKQLSNLLCVSSMTSST